MKEKLPPKNMIVKFLEHPTEIEDTRSFQRVHNSSWELMYWEFD